MSLDLLLRDALRGLLRELLVGPPGELAFIVNPGDTGLLGSLSRLSPEEASARPNGRSSVAAHVQHLRYGFGLLNRWIGGDGNAFADAEYAESWKLPEVAGDEWRELRHSLEREVRAWSDALTAPREWEPVTLSGAISSVAHFAYHVGAIRQLTSAAAGPKAVD